MKQLDCSQLNLMLFMHYIAGSEKWRDNSGSVLKRDEVPQARVNRTMLSEGEWLG
jgi:hypothetical protein